MNLQLEKSPWFLPLIAATALAALSPSSALAQGTAAQQAKASQSEYRKAHDAALAHNWPEAQRILLGLWKKSKTYDVAASLSEAEFGLGHAAASAIYMDYALRHVTPNESAETVENMKSALQKIRPRVTSVKVSVSDPAAVVSVDESVVELEPDAELFVEPGKHVFRARLGEQVAEQTLEASAGREEVVQLRLPPAPAAPHPTTSPSKVHANAEPSDKNRVIALVVGGAVTVVGLGTGIGFGLASNSSESDAENARGRVGSSNCSGSASAADCQALRTAVDDQRRNGHLANVGFGIAVAGVATVGVALLWPRSERAPAKSSRPAQPRLALQIAGNAVYVGGSF